MVERSPETQDHDAPSSDHETSRLGGAMRLLLILALLLAVVLGAVFALGARRASELEVSIILPKERFLQGRKIPMKLSVKNVSNGPVAVERWAERDDDGQCSQFSGMPVDLELYYETLPEPILRASPEAAAESGALLEPGESMSFKCDLANLFGIIKPGDYRLKGAYIRDSWALEKGSPAWLAELWASRLGHEEVSFQVLSRVYDEMNDKTTKAGAMVERPAEN